MHTSSAAASAPVRGSGWWRDAVVYQVYPRSFADGNGDGMGDLAGLRDRLSYIRSLGVDAIWINPWYPSPMADGGYDVADYRDVEPVFGTLADAQALIEEAHARGLRILLDIVPNHTSSRHQWFRAALAAGPGSPERHRYIFRPGRGDGSEPPNDWSSVFGGPAWTRVTEADGRPGEWYLHLFDVEQPDLNWGNPEVHAEFASILRFWFDRGVDGFRVDVANALFKHPDLPDLDGRESSFTADLGDEHPFSDREVVHEVYRAWRAIADEYDEPRVFVAEAWVHSPERLARYVRPGQLHSAFNFHFLRTPWRADLLQASIREALEALRAVDAEPTWVLSNHDVARVVSRLGLPQPERFDPAAAPVDVAGMEPDLDIGTRRARAAALLMLSLPGGAYVYQGEELGLWEVTDLPEALLQDPTWRRSRHTVRGRDGCRVPLPWAGDRPPFGFAPPGGHDPWLPQPAAWAALTVESQDGRPGSTLELYRAALRIRRSHPGLGSGPLRWLDVPAGALAFERAGGFVCVVNVEAAPLPLPAHDGILLASGPLERGRLPADTAIWLQAGDVPEGV